MGKFRSKLKRHTKGKSWSHGHSSTSNPENQKHRIKAKSRFFQPNLSLAPVDPTKKSPLTLEAVLKHEARQSFATGNDEPTINDIAQSMKSFNIDEDDMSESHVGGTFKTFQTFASNWSACSNVSFNKLLHRFRSDSPQHKEMLAILAAITEVIKERGGTQSSTEYFLALMETLDASKEDSDTIASISLLGMGIKSVPEAVLRRKFSETAQLLLDLMQRFVDTDHQNVLRSIIGCLSILLRAQEYSTWGSSSTIQYFEAILSFTTHTKPKIRKSAQHAITSILLGSCFMLPPKRVPKEDDEDMEEEEPKPVLSGAVKYHPAGSRVVKFCIGHFSPSNIGNSQTIVLHILGLLKDIIHGFKSDDIKQICEHLLSIMTAANVLIRTNCFQTLHSLFLSSSPNLTGTLVGKIVTAMYDYRPDKSDSRQTLAWLVSLKQGLVVLATLDITLCCNSLPRFVDICAGELWMSDKMEVAHGSSTGLLEILRSCVSFGCETKELSDRHRISINKIIQTISKTLSAPFGHIANHLILTLAVVFEVTGKYFSSALEKTVVHLGSLYDEQSSYRVQIEHAILAAIGSMGPETVLKCIPLSDAKGEICLNRSWILPLLREAIVGSSFEFFSGTILKLASQCYNNWNKNKDANKPMAHTYELLCCQLWSLFPGFCRKPKDPQNFKCIAKTLGTILNDNPELRAPVLDGLKELIGNSDENCKIELAKYSKNYLPRLFNIYTTKPQGTHEGDVREQTFVVIKEYLTVTPQEILEEMFTTAMGQLEESSPGTFIADALFDIVEALALHQTSQKLQKLYDKYIAVIIKKKDKKEIVSKDELKFRKQQKKAYSLLNGIMTSENEGCVKFTEQHISGIEKMLLNSHSSTCKFCLGIRITCLKSLLVKHDSVDDEVVQQIVPEAVLAFNEFSKKEENSSHEVIKIVAEMYQNEDKLNSFVDLLIAGFAGDSLLITNTIWALKVIVQNFTGNLTVNTLSFVLEQVTEFIVSKNREEAQASISFLVTFIKVLPSPLVGNHLPKIMKSLSLMVPDTKRISRIQIGYVLTKLCKKFGADEIIKLVPGNDEVTHKRLRKIRKQVAREKRQKLQDKSKEDSDDEDGDDLEKKSYTIDEILADSDSDMDEDNKDKSKTKKKKHDTYIQETPESIVDLADINSIGKITTSRPMETTSEVKESKPKENRGFKTADDGRLIIKEGSDDSDSSSDDMEDIDMDSNKKTANKRGFKDDDQSDSDEEDEGVGIGPSRKRKALDSKSMASGRSGASSKYIAGGKGIHRPTAESVKSGVSRMSSATTKTAKSTNSQSGGSYKAKKAKGDMKKKGQVDPFAYIPLTRNSLNKRKRAKNAGQFKNIVDGARKGAAAGSKSKANKVHKAYRK